MTAAGFNLMDGQSSGEGPPSTKLQKYLHHLWWWCSGVYREPRSTCVHDLAGNMGNEASLLPAEHSCCMSSASHRPIIPSQFVPSQFVPSPSHQPSGLIAG